MRHHTVYISFYDAEITFDEQGEILSHSFRSPDAPHFLDDIFEAAREEALVSFRESETPRTK